MSSPVTARLPWWRASPPTRLLAAALLTSLMAGCAVPAGSVGPDPSAGSSNGAAIPVASAASAEASETVFTATDDGLSLTVATDDAVASGDTLAIDVKIHNGRSEPVVMPTDECGAAAGMHATVPLPLDPAGKTWDGIAGEFKRYALEQGYREGGAPAAAPGWVNAVPNPCGQGNGDQTLAPGETARVALSWPAALLKGIPALPGKVPFTVSVLHDKGLEFTFPPDWKGPVGGIIPDYRVLSVDGTINITGDPPDVLTPGQAIDVVLADDRFTKWLGKQPRKSWAVANVYLTETAMGGDNGSFWNVELFRAPRNSAIGSVDATTGDLHALKFCNRRCDH
jgi:hypothetical protein